MNDAKTTPFSEKTVIPYKTLLSASSLTMQRSGLGFPPPPNRYFPIHETDKLETSLCQFKAPNWKALDKCRKIKREKEKNGQPKHPLLEKKFGVIIIILNYLNLKFFKSINLHRDSLFTLLIHSSIHFRPKDFLYNQKVKKKKIYVSSTKSYINVNVPEVLQYSSSNDTLGTSITEQAYRVN